ncbi:MAG: tyrosine-type recombinase/integrase [Pseudonocardiaceae bacterium]
MRAEKKPERTAVLYGRCVRMFCEWLAAHGRPATLDELTRAAVREWLTELAETREASTVRTRFKGLHRFCGWLVNEGGSTSTRCAPSPRRPAPKPVPVPDDDELAALIKVCAGKDFTDRRDEALIRLLLDTGIRVSEACRLAVSDADLDREMAMVTGKGNKIRPVYFGARTARALDRYVRERRRHRWCHLDALFLTQRGALSTDGARDRIKVRAAAAGLRDRMHPHWFRHSSPPGTTGDPQAVSRVR